MPSWIEEIPESEWAEHRELAALHPEVVDPETHQVDNIMAIHSLNPTGLAAHNALYRSAMTGTATLRKVERELLAYVISLDNECDY